jgi:hypothetical protein
MTKSFSLIKMEALRVVWLREMKPKLLDPQVNQVKKSNLMPLTLIKKVKGLLHKDLSLIIEES